MPYLIYPPSFINDPTVPAYAVPFPDAVDEIVIADLRAWGWQVEKDDVDDPSYQKMVRDYYALTSDKSGKATEAIPALWEVWLEASAQIPFYQPGGGRVQRPVRRVVEDPRKRARGKGRNEKSTLWTSFMIKKLLRKCSFRKELEIQEIPLNSWSKIMTGDGRYDGPGILVIRTIEASSNLWPATLRNDATLEEKMGFGRNEREFMRPLEEPRNRY